MHITYILILGCSFLLGIFQDSETDNGRIILADPEGIIFIAIVFACVFISTFFIAIFGRIQTSENTQRPSLRNRFLKNRHPLQFPFIISCIFLASALGATVRLTYTQQSINDLILITVSGLGLFIGTKVFSRLLYSNRT